MASARVTRKDIKRDELAAGLTGLSVAVQEHARSVGIAVAAIVVLGLAVGGGVWYSRSQAAAAQVKLGAVYKALSAPVTEEGAGASLSTDTAPYATRRQKYEEVARLSGIVRNDHPSSTAAKWAAYYTAVARKELGDHAGALEALTPIAAGSDDLLSCSAKYLVGQVKEASGDLAGALEAYARLVESAPAGFPVEMAMMSQARILEGQGKTEEAREIYRRITQEHPDSPFSRDASQRLSPPPG